MSAKDNKEENKNIDVERQVVVATYYAPSSVFTSTRHTVIGLNTTSFTSTGRKKTKTTKILKRLDLI